MKMVTANEYVKKHSTIANIRVVDERLLRETYKRRLLERAQNLIIEIVNIGFGVFETEFFDDVFYIIVKIVSKNKKAFVYEFGEDFARIFHDKYFPQEEFCDWLQSYGWELVVEDDDEWEYIGLKTFLYEEDTGLKVTIV